MPLCVNKNNVPLPSHDPPNTTLPLMDSCTSFPKMQYPQQPLVFSLSCLSYPHYNKASMVNEDYPGQLCNGN